MAMAMAKIMIIVIVIIHHHENGCPVTRHTYYEFNTHPFREKDTPIVAQHPHFLRHTPLDIPQTWVLIPIRSDPTALHNNNTPAAKCGKGILLPNREHLTLPANKSKY